MQSTSNGYRDSIEKHAYQLAHRQDYRQAYGQVHRQARYQTRAIRGTMRFAHFLTHNLNKRSLLLGSNYTHSATTSLVYTVRNRSVRQPVPRFLRDPPFVHKLPAAQPRKWLQPISHTGKQTTYRDQVELLVYCSTCLSTQTVAADINLFMHLPYLRYLHRS